MPGRFVDATESGGSPEIQFSDQTASKLGEGNHHENNNVCPRCCRFRRGRHGDRSCPVVQFPRARFGAGFIACFLCTASRVLRRFGWKRQFGELWRPKRLCCRNVQRLSGRRTDFFRIGCGARDYFHGLPNHVRPLRAGRVFPEILGQRLVVGGQIFIQLFGDNLDCPECSASAGRIIHGDRDQCCHSVLSEPPWSDLSKPTFSSR